MKALHSRTPTAHPLLARLRRLASSPAELQPVADALVDNAEAARRLGGSSNNLQFALGVIGAVIRATDVFLVLYQSTRHEEVAVAGILAEIGGADSAIVLTISQAFALELALLELDRQVGRAHRLVSSLSVADAGLLRRFVARAAQILSEHFTATRDQPQEEPTPDPLPPACGPGTCGLPAVLPAA